MGSIGNLLAAVLVMVPVYGACGADWWQPGTQIPPSDFNTPTRDFNTPTRDFNTPTGDFYPAATPVASDPLSLTTGIAPIATTPYHPSPNPPQRPFNFSRKFAWKGSKLQLKCCEAKAKLWADCENYYSWDTTRKLLLGLAAGSVLANTSMDDDFQNWYQDEVRSASSDDFADACKIFGEGQIFIPAFAGAAALSLVFDQYECGQVLGDFVCRTTRGYLVGAPPMVAMQAILGASRPGETDHQSRWKPFDDNNAVSGHAFMGAMPFITAAKMTDRPLLKGGLYFCSTLTAWSRINDNKHYLSQAILGWWMAYLTCCAVDKTDNDYQHLTFTPVTTSEMVGVGVIFER